jgi:transcriptional regulator with XRE-family HTH domain
MSSTPTSPLDLQPELGTRLRRLRVDRNLTQAELASRANLNRDTVQQLERSGKGSVASLLSVLWALGERDALDKLAPRPGFSPIQAFRSHKERQRVRRPDNPGAK